MKRGELAARLGVRPEQLLTRAEAARIIGVGTHTLRASPNSYPGFYSADSGDTYYDQRTVENFRAWKVAGRPQEPLNGNPDPYRLARTAGGRLPDPPDPGVANAALAMMVAARWKAAEIARRWDLTMYDVQESARLFASESSAIKPNKAARLGQPFIVQYTSHFKWPRGATPPDNMGSLVQRYWLDIIREHEHALELAMAADVLPRSDQ